MPKDRIIVNLKKIEDQMLAEYKQNAHMVLFFMMQDVRGLIARRKIFLKQQAKEQAKIVPQKSSLLCERIHDREYELEVARWESEGGLVP